jgi:GntR family transcriptional regulator, arabinose operon transcriptional repressor
MDKKLLDKNRGVVLYQQLANVLRQHFCEADLQVGNRIPTEFELSSTFGVSRGTVRQALSLLEKEGLIYRVQGLGTFLNAKETPAIPINSERRIGLIVPYAQDQLSLNILVGVESAAKKRGYQVVFSHSNENLQQEKEDIARLRADRAAGVILFPVSNCEIDENIEELYTQEFPFVLVDRYFPRLDCSYVVSDNLSGGYRATEHLIILGYTQIAFLYHIDADFRTTSVRDRFLGYQKALAEYNIEFNESYVQPLASPSLINGEDSLAEYIDFLNLPDRPQATFAVNDNTAINLIIAAFRLGLRIPDDLAVVGFDNLGISTQVQVPLTTIHVHRTEMGEKAADLLIDWIEGRIAQPEHIILPTELIIRESCGTRSRLRKGGIPVATP